MPGCRSSFSFAPLRRVWCLTLALGLILANVREAAAQRFLIDPNDPESSVPAIAELEAHPLDFGYLLMGLAEMADKALAEKEYPVAEKYYRALIKAVPAAATGYSKLCQVYQLMQQAEPAAAACRLAMGKPGATVADYQRFVQIVLDQPDAQLNPETIADVDAALEHLRSQNLGTAADELGCQLAMRLNDVGRLQTCIQSVRVNSPGDKRISVYEWTLAVTQESFPRMRSLLQEFRGREDLKDVLPVMEEAFRTINRREHPVMAALEESPWLWSGVAVMAVGGLGSVILSRRRRVRAAASV
jgi:hypothetical protein